MKQFTNGQYTALLHSTVENVMKLSKLKGGEYSGDQDRLANFRRNALALGLSMEHVWAVFAGKHWDAIQQFVKDLSVGVERTRAEPIAGRADDLIVYLILFKAMLQERENALLDAKGRGAKSEVNRASDTMGPVGSSASTKSPPYKWPD